MQGFRARATAGREEGLPQSPPQRPRRSRRSAYIPAAVPLFPGAPFPWCPFSLIPLFRPPRSPGASLSRYPVVPLSRSPFASAFSACLRTPKPAILGTRTLENLPPCPKTRHFGLPSPGKGPSVPQNMPFWGPEAGYSTLPLGKTAVFAHPKTKNRPLVGQNRHFCPSAGGQGRTRQQEMASLGWGYVLARRAGYPGRHTGGRIENNFAGDVNDSHICA